MAMLESSPSKRNKRKSAEPMKRLSTNLDQDFNNAHHLQNCMSKRPKLEQTSDGEDHHTSPSPRLSSSLSPGSSTECRSPSPFSMAPKKRFKSEALKDIKSEPHLIPPGIYHPYLLLLQHPKALELTGNSQFNYF